MTIPGEPRAWLEQYPPGVFHPLTQAHQGIAYPGQVIRAERWQPEFGEALTGEVYFRIVLLIRPRVGLRPDLRDARIAIATPGDGSGRQRGQLGSELATIRETQARYRVQRNPEADLIRRTLQRRSDQLEEQLLAQEAARYASGSVVTGGSLTPDAAPFFEGTDPAAWFGRLTAYLLAQAYPTSPLNWSALPRPITAADPPRLWKAIFGQPDGEPEILAQLAAGLHLPNVGSLAGFDPATNPVFQLLRQRRPVAPAPWAELHHYLAHQVGLTGALASLYLLRWLHLEQPPLELRLTPGHNLKLGETLPLPGQRLTAELVPLLAWPADLERHALTLGPETPPAWNDALPLLAMLAPQLTALSPGWSQRPQETALRERLAELQAEVFQARFVAAQLGDAGVAADLAEVTPALARLETLGGDDFRAVYAAARLAYRDARQLQADLSALEELAQLARAAPVVTAAWRYLAEAAVPPALAELVVERETLQAALTPASLLRSARRWPALQQQVAGFKTRYAAAYRTHHAAIQHELPGFLRDLEAARRQQAALALLNTLPELGEPVGAALARDLDAIAAPRPCPVPPADLDLAERPRCAFCSLSLAHTLPTSPLARLRAVLDALLGEKNRQLSGLLVDRILQGQADQRLDDFLKIVQASNLTALVNTLSPDLVAFIRPLLR